MTIEKLMCLCSGFLHCLHDGIAVVDMEGKIVFVNEANYRITGIPQEKLLEHKVEIAVPFSHVPEVLKNGKEMVGVKSIVNAKEVLSNIAPIVIENKMIGAVSVFQDLTEITDLTQRLEAAEVTIKTLVKELSNANSINPDIVIGTSPTMAKAVDLARKSAKVTSTVIIRGESGTGKEVIARLIHQLSPRNQGPFIAVNCAAIPETLLESELFGYAEGAFTGAKKGGHPGLVELAKGGTLFLDEIGDMPYALQGKMLRILQDKEYMSIGATQFKESDVRFIVATHRDLEDLISKKLFREDLYYRLGVIKICVPPLRSRKEDLVKYIEHIAENLSKKMNRPNPSISKAVIKAFYEYTFPGNFRELENMIEMAMVLDEDGYLSLEDFPAFFTQAIDRTTASEAKVEFALEFDKVPTLKEVESLYIDELTKRFDNRKKISKIAGIARSTLYKKLEPKDNLR